MGLDMYLYRTKKVEGLSIEDYNKIDNYVSEVDNITNINLEKELNIPHANELLTSINRRGEYISWYSIYEQVGYWRKANQIHDWFVEEVQGGEDECRPHIVERYHIEKLLSNVHLVLAERGNEEVAYEYLPTSEGFFFGSTDYDEWYYQDLEETKAILDKVLSETDFENEIIVYRSSW